MNNINIIDFVTSIFRLQVPVILKGELLVNIMAPKLLFHKEVTRVEFNWIGILPTMRELKEILSTIASEYNLAIKINNHYTVNKPAEFRLHNDNQSFDIAIYIKRTKHISTYNINDTIIKGIAINEIITNSIKGLSGSRIHKQVSNLYNLYVISMFNGYSLNNFNTINDLGSFKEFDLSNRMLLRSYGIYGIIRHKPNYYAVFNRVDKFIEPFRAGYSNLIWHNGQWESETKHYRDDLLNVSFNEQEPSGYQNLKRVIIQ